MLMSLDSFVTNLESERQNMHETFMKENPNSVPAQVYSGTPDGTVEKPTCMESNQVFILGTGGKNIDPNTGITQVLSYEKHFSAFLGIWRPIDVVEFWLYAMDEFVEQLQRQGIPDPIILATFNKLADKVRDTLSNENKGGNK